MFTMQRIEKTPWIADVLRQSALDAPYTLIARQIVALIADESSRANQVVFIGCTRTLVSLFFENDILCHLISISTADS